MFLKIPATEIIAFPIICALQPSASRAEGKRSASQVNSLVICKQTPCPFTEIKAQNVKQFCSICDRAKHSPVPKLNLPLKYRV